MALISAATWQGRNEGIEMKLDIPNTIIFIAISALIAIVVNLALPEYRMAATIACFLWGLIAPWLGLGILEKNKTR